MAVAVHSCRGSARPTATVVVAPALFPARSVARSTTVYVPLRRGTCQPNVRLP